MADIQVLTELMEAFIAGRDRSMKHVDRIEGILIKRFRGTELFEELSPAVASYRPGGGQHYYDEEQLALQFEYVLRRLKDEGGQDLTAR
jgi:hypothetical protein